MYGERLILTFFAQVTLILAVTRVVGWILSRFRQPLVLGEMIGAVILGPSVLGWVAPQVYQRIFPTESLVLLGVVAQIAVILFVFLVGLEWGAALPQSGRAQKILSAVGTVLLLRPLLKRLQMIFEYRGKIGHNVLAALLLLLVACSLATGWAGVHWVAGALLLGILMPQNAKFARQLGEKFQDLVMVFLLPLFLAWVGLRTEVRLISPQMWLLATGVFAIACVAKSGRFL